MSSNHGKTNLLAQKTQSGPELVPATISKSTLNFASAEQIWMGTTSKSL